MSASGAPVDEGIEHEGVVKSSPENDDGDSCEKDEENSEMAAPAAEWEVFLKKADARGTPTKVKRGMKSAAQAGSKTNEDTSKTDEEQAGTETSKTEGAEAVVTEETDESEVVVPRGKLPGCGGIGSLAYMFQVKAKDSDDDDDDDDDEDDSDEDEEDDSDSDDLDSSELSEEHTDEEVGSDELEAMELDSDELAARAAKDSDDDDEDDEEDEEEEEEEEEEGT